jgi:hypothetical protein
MLLRCVERSSINCSGKTCVTIGGLAFQQGLQAAIYKTLSGIMYQGNAFSVIVTCRDQIVHLVPPSNRDVVIRNNSRVNLNHDRYWSYRKL